MGDSDDIVVESEDDGAEEKADAKLKRLRQELKKAHHERDEYLAGWQRSKADYINLSRRVREEDRAQERLGAARIARGVIAALDSIEAAKNAPNHNAAAIEALEPIGRQLQDALCELDVTRFTPVPGDRLDPARHEPIQTVATDDENEDNTVSETLQSGYAVGDTVIRPARVAVNHYQPND